MLTARYYAASYVVGGRIYVAGGRDAAYAAVSVVESYDPVADRWSTVASMPAPCRNLAGSVVVQRVNMFDRVLGERQAGEAGGMARAPVVVAGRAGRLAVAGGCCAAEASGGDGARTKRLVVMLMCVA